MSKLLTTTETAALLGITAGTLSNRLKALGLTAACQKGSAKLYDRADVERAVRERDAAKLARRASRKSEAQTTAQANDTMARELQVSEQRHAWNDGRLRPLNARERAIVYAAFLAGTLGPTSQWTKASPPDSYRAAYESFLPLETRDDDEQAYAEAEVTA